MQHFSNNTNFRISANNTDFYTIQLTCIFNRVMPISPLFMLAYQIRNPVHCWSPSPFLVGVPTISSINCGSPCHIHFFFSCGSPRHSFLFLAGVPAIFSFSFAGVPVHSFLFLAGVPASYLFQLRESPPILFFTCRSPRLIFFSHAGVPAHLGLLSFSNSSKFDKQR